MGGIRSKPHISSLAVQGFEGIFPSRGVGTPTLPSLELGRPELLRLPAGHSGCFCVLKKCPSFYCEVERGRQYFL